MMNFDNISKGKWSEGRLWSKENDNTTRNQETGREQHHKETAPDIVLVYNDFIVGQILVHAGMCAPIGEEVAAMGQRQGNDEDEHNDEVLISTVVPL
jgi:hypothetical protein